MTIEEISIFVQILNLLVAVEALQLMKDLNR